ncbi:hypothetical protein VP01_7524g1, partial [Puccinia sorghi]
FHKVWIISRKAGNQKPLNRTWVLKIKKNQLNVPATEYKARLCVKGFQQFKGT